ncbi:hypothetical protein Dimus_021240 [Dionaea muscipula]
MPKDEDILSVHRGGSQPHLAVEGLRLVLSLVAEAYDTLVGQLREGSMVEIGMASSPCPRESGSDSACHAGTKLRIKEKSGEDWGLSMSLCVCSWPRTGNERSSLCFQVPSWSRCGRRVLQWIGLRWMGNNRADCVDVALENPTELLWTRRKSSSAFDLRDPTREKL